jgi:hypothetical protein
VNTTPVTVTQEVACLREPQRVDDVHSSLAPFWRFPHNKIVYPPIIKSALGLLFQEYNSAFQGLVAANQEGVDDYRFARSSKGRFINRWVQIDMGSLSSGFLNEVRHLSDRDASAVSQVADRLRRVIFEFENSIAMYQLLCKIFPGGSFAPEFRSSLDQLREQSGRPVALLAVTEEKYQAMLQAEFGASPEAGVSNAVVRERTGFDAFWGPQQFLDHLDANGDCRYTLFARTSHPTRKLANPSVEVLQPLLGDPELRRIIKRNAITFNIDGPGVGLINDTKAYQPAMGMGYAAEEISDVITQQCLDFTKKGRAFADFTGERAHPAMKSYLERHYGIDPGAVETGLVSLRAKPMYTSYGCYGHVSGGLNDKAFRHELLRGIRQRGHYVLQPELPASYVTDSASGRRYQCIDRIFMSCVDEVPAFMSGFRSYMPCDTVEAMRGRVHGSRDTAYGLIE